MVLGYNIFPMEREDILTNESADVGMGYKDGMFTVDTSLFLAHPPETVFPFFAGQIFDLDVSTDANYKFSSYRFTYRFYNGPTWR